MKEKRSLRTMLLRIAIVPTVSVLIVLLGIILLSANLVRKEIDERQQLAIDTLTQQTDHYLVDTERLMHSLGAMLSTLPEGYETQVLAQTRANYPRFSALYVLDATGQVIAEDTDTEALLGLDMSGAAFYRHARDRKHAYFSAPFLSLSTNKIAVTGAIPLFREERLWRVLVGELDLQLLEDMIVQTSIGQSTSFIVDASGTLIAHPNSTWVQERRNLGDHPLIAAELAQRRSPGIFYDSDQNTWLIGRAATIGSAWVAVTTQPLVIAARPMIVLFGASLGAFAFSLALFLWMQVYNLRRITVPISQLVEQANLLAQHPDQPLPVAPVGEFGEIASLSASFVHMARAVAQRTIELNEELEQRKHTQAALLASEERYRSLYDGVPIGLYRTTPDGQVLDANPALLEILSYPDKASLLAISVPDRYVNPRDRLRWQALIEDEGRVHGFEVELARHDGTTIWVRETAHAVRGQDGEVLYYEGSLEDITERRRTTEALRQSNEFLQSVLDNSPSSIFVRDLEGRYLLINRAFQQVIGRTPEEAIGGTPEALHRPQAAALIARGDRLVLESGKPFTSEDDVLVDDEPHTFIATKVPLRDASGQIYALCTVATDITERKRSEVEKERLQERLVQAQKMEAVGRLAGGIAHDFNNVLTSIRGYGHFLLDDLASDDPTDWPVGRTIRADLREILTSADRAASLTRQLLAFSRKQVLQPRMLDLNDLLYDMQNMLHRLLGEDIGLTIVAGEDLEYVRADPGQMEQVIMNLSVNARDAMPRGGELTFETANIELDHTHAESHPDMNPGWYVMLAVTDNGMGMSAEVKAHLFEPFFTTKEQGRGTGLGLATVYGIIEQSGGHIEVHSEVNVGATFKVYLPVASGATDLREPAEAVQNLPAGTETVLLVEDEQPVRDLVSRVLGRCGYTVLSAGLPQEAFALSDELAGSVDLLVTDVVMPEMGGVELAERLVASRPEMRVLYISGYTDDAVARHGALDGEGILLEKPFTPASLAQKVREVLDAPRAKEPPA